jgi:hypothetical protein
MQSAPDERTGWGAERDRQLLAGPDGGPGKPELGRPETTRGTRQFRTRGLQNVNNEFTLAMLAFNVTRLYAARAA